MDGMDMQWVSNFNERLPPWTLVQCTWIFLQTNCEICHLNPFLNSLDFKNVPLCKQCLRLPTPGLDWRTGWCLQNSSWNKARSSGFHCPFTATQSVAHVPAEVCRENVDAFIFGQQGMESTSVRSIYHVAFFRCPEFQFAAKQHFHICCQTTFSHSFTFIFLLKWHQNMLLHSNTTYWVR